MKSQRIAVGGEALKTSVADRLRSIREELDGEDGGTAMAGRLGLPVQTWLNYEGGVTISGDVLLRFLLITDSEPFWLLKGGGAKYRNSAPVVVKWPG